MKKNNTRKMPKGMSQLALGLGMAYQVLAYLVIPPVFLGWLGSRLWGQTGAMIAGGIGFGLGVFLIYKVAERHGSKTK